MALPVVTLASAPTILGLLILLAALAGTAVYLGRRGGVFGSGTPRRSGSGQKSERDLSYPTRIREVLAVMRERNPNMGSMDFDEDPFVQLLTHLDSLEPPAEAPHYGRHRGYRDAVANFVDVRRGTVSALDEATPLIRSITRQEVADCRTVAGARDLMATYGRSVDPQLEALVERCQAERPAWEAMGQRLHELDAALYRLRFDPGG